MPASQSGRNRSRGRTSSSGTVRWIACRHLVVQRSSAIAVTFDRRQSSASLATAGGWLHNQPLLWTGPRRVRMLFYSSARPRVALPATERHPLCQKCGGGSAMNDSYLELRVVCEDLPDMIVDSGSICVTAGGRADSTAYAPPSFLILRGGRYGRPLVTGYWHDSTPP